MDLSTGRELASLPSLRLTYSTFPGHETHCTVFLVSFDPSSHPVFERELLLGLEPIPVSSQNQTTSKMLKRVKLASCFLPVLFTFP